MSEEEELSEEAKEGNSPLGDSTTLEHRVQALEVARHDEHVQTRTQTREKEAAAAEDEDQGESNLADP